MVKVLKLASVLAAAAVAVFIFNVGSSDADAQGGRAGGPNTPTGPTIGWTTYGANLASHRYSPADQITKDNFNQLRIAWRLKTDLLGPRIDTLYSSTPLLVDRVLYTTAGMRRAVIALNPTTGEMLWLHSEDEGVRGQNAIRQGAGRGLSYWASANGQDRRILYVTPGYRLKALDAKTGLAIPSFGKDGAVDLKLEADQEIDLNTGEMGLNATPLVVGDVIVVGMAHRPGSAPRTMRNAKGAVRGYDVRTGKRLWIFHTLPKAGEFGYDTWLENGAEINGNTAVWSQMSADAELGLVYVPVEMPTGDYYGGHRPGDTLFADSLLALDVKTGKRKWHFQTVHHDVWDWDLPCAPMLFDMTVNGRTVKAIAQPTKQAMLFVFNRETGEPIWPIEERPVPQSDVPKERTSPTQPFPTKPLPFDLHGITENDLNDLTPAIKAEALEVVKRYKMGPIFTPPVVSNAQGPLATLQVPSEVGGANWPGGSMDPDNNFLYIHSHTNVYANGLVPPTGPAAVGHGVHRRAGARRWPGAGRARTRRHRAGPAAPQAAVRPHHRLQHEHRRHRLAEAAQLDAGRHQESPADERPGPAAARPAGPHVHRRVDDEEPGDCRRGRRAFERRRTTCCAAARLRQAHRRGCRCCGDAEQADRVANELSDRRQAVHRPRSQRERWRGTTGLLASVIHSTSN